MAGHLQIFSHWVYIGSWPATGSGRSLELAGHWIIALPATCFRHFVDADCFVATDTMKPLILQLRFHFRSSKVNLRHVRCHVTHKDPEITCSTGASHCLEDQSQRYITVSSDSLRRQRHRRGPVTPGTRHKFTTATSTGSLKIGQQIRKQTCQEQRVQEQQHASRGLKLPNRHKHGTVLK